MEKSEWDESMPFKRFQPLMRVFAALPTLPLHEWSTRALFLVALKHALSTGKQELFASAVCSAVLSALLARSSLLKYSSRPAVRFPAQAGIMLAPRQSLHELELCSAGLYLSFLAARRHGGVQRSRLAEACFAALLAHLLAAPAGINGPRFLWWTWHEDHPEVRDRVLNFPASQALLELAGGFSFSLLGNWLLDLTPEYSQKPAVASLVQSVPEVFSWLPADNRQVLQSLAGVLDALQLRVEAIHPVAKVAVLGLLFPALQQLVSLVAQIVSLDTVGKPSARSYKVLVALLALAASRWSATDKSLPVKIVDSDAGFTLASAVVAYFAAQAMISSVGEADKHVSTGVHQPYGRGATQRRDAFGNRYQTHVSSEHGTRGFSVEGAARSALVQELQDKRESLEDMARFRKAAEKRVHDTELALQETLAWSKQTMKQIPHLNTADQFVREMEATNSVRVARIKAHLEEKLAGVKLERSRVETMEQMLRAKIAKVEGELEMGSLDPAGNVVVAASEFGPQSVWYTIRGVVPANQREETVGVFLLGALGVTAFTKSLAFGA